MDKNLFLNDLKLLETENKSAVQLYNEISALAMHRLQASAKKGKCAHYLSIEFLIGRVFYNNLLELGVLEETAKILKKKGVDISVFEEIEDAALGNGGLGRLAACYLDSGAAVGVPLYGYGIRYKFGLFRQKFENGFQIEMPDDWQRFGDPWSVRREHERQVVHFADMDVEAVPYDMPIAGKRVNVLRLYQAEGSESAEKISGVLYPADDTEEGKLLRIRQEYFLSAAAVGDIVKEHERLHGDLASFAQYSAVQLNDTHPVFAIPELIRVLVKKGVSYVGAVKIAKETFDYTNHTILPEALECWDARLVRKILPDIAGILRALSDTQARLHKKRGYTRAEIEQTAIYQPKNQTFSMANAAVFVADKVNGVADIHSEIIKRKLFAAEYRHMPEKFTNVTNGVAQRRWLMLANPELCALIDRRIGKEWRQDFEKLSEFGHFICEQKTISEFIAVKREKKNQLFSHIAKQEKTQMNGERMVYAQVKRLHEYKRQLMTAFALVRLYRDLKENKLPDFTPSLFLFGAKSAPGYARAKGIIKYINEIIAKIDADDAVRGRLAGVFVTEYNVSYAEKIVAAADVSLQVSTAGLEASGTGNMKFMMNGAVTLGTMDGANIEIVEKAGEKNNYIFGARVEEIERLRAGGYDPAAYLKDHPEWAKIAETLVDGTYSDGGTGIFRELYDSLLVGASWHKPDHYFIFRDIEEYYQAILRANADYAQRERFAEKQLKNVANSAYFSSDRSVLEYADKIWHIQKDER
ncbi:glycogen/starch/alpha-glucan family phosphorylase [Candidatus Borkfalkia ceftriaxoniphila]|uniref:Alpha-1,4 glucan phosphorylase n=1 Tax=Candidatus Borkfalkia ceftriaxoniphila TaxID=2508949 RepID=A0A4Q2KGD5_9FIRM|nr:glycogen/starch/alpha-glucan family phosphorylase [Candidatus Borkfalkia ceftriaxoniphila]RXZ62121.1 glycogen/starch/alpha-glucan family phosphorylase [Candidatus Borkfalkia ceftriaxoniphila]